MRSHGVAPDCPAGSGDLVLCAKYLRVAMSRLCLYDATFNAFEALSELSPFDARYWLINVRNCFSAVFRHEASSAALAPRGAIATLDRAAANAITSISASF